MAASIAVIIPCFDDGGTLEAAVASAQSQEVPTDIVVVDDGATDPATKAAYERLDASGVRVIHQVNQGPAPARMAGVRATDTDYVFALDADDLLAPGGLQRLREVLDHHPDAAAAWGTVRAFGEVELTDPCRPSLDPWEISYHNHLPVGSLYRRSALTEAGGWQLAGGYEDWDLWMTLAELGWKGIGIPDVVANYRVQSGRRLSRSSQRHAERYARLRARHPILFGQRSRNRRASTAPLALKLCLPVIDALPLDLTKKRLLGGAITHFAYGDSWRKLVSRYRANRVVGRTMPPTSGSSTPSGS